jgi:hypothetical protein
MEEFVTVETLSYVKNLLLDFGRVDAGFLNIVLVLSQRLLIHQLF